MCCTEQREWTQTLVLCSSILFLNQSPCTQFSTCARTTAQHVYMILYLYKPWSQIHEWLQVGLQVGYYLLTWTYTQTHLRLSFINPSVPTLPQGHAQAHNSLPWLASRPLKPTLLRPYLLYSHSNNQQCTFPTWYFTLISCYTCLTYLPQGLSGEVAHLAILNWCYLLNRPMTKN